MKLKRLFLSGIAALTAFSAVSAAASADELVTGIVSVTQAAATSGVNVAYRSQDAIRSYIAAHQFSTTDKASFTRSPDLTSPYTDSGALSSATRNNALNALNVMRYIAGLDAVTLNDEYNALCQDGAYISALNGNISHTPSKPSGVSDTLFKSGYTACSSSNLAAGFPSLGASILGYMDDSDSYNIADLGHRRWCLNPPMKQVGFGQVDTGKGYRSYSAMYAFDDWYGDTDISGVVWPAQNMPVEYFDDGQAWSYSLGSAITNTSAVSVTLTRKSDGKVWKFSKGSSNGDFYVEGTHNYGQQGCVIFRPSGVGDYKAGDVFTVKISGLPIPVEYTVNFFSTATKPAAVTGFKAESVTSNSLDLTWNPVVGASSYQIDLYWNGEWSYFTKTSGTSIPVTGLMPNTSYQFRIFAYNGNQYSNSTKLTVTTPSAGSTSAKPSAVTGFTGSAASTNSISLSWNKVTGADSYQIDVYKNGKWTYLTKTSGTSFTATGLSAGTSYQFRIFAYNGSQYSSSAKVTVSTKSASTSTKPSAVTVFKDSSTSTNSITLTWNKVSNADSYQIDIYKNGKWMYLTKTSGTSYTATGLSAGTSYQFRIFAFNGSQYSSSTKLTASTKSSTSTAKPSAVTGFKTSSTSANSITLTWNKVSNADSYQIDVYKNGTWTYLTKTAGTSYTVTNLAAGTSHQFRIFAFKGSQFSSSTKLTASTTSSSASKPTPVTTFKATSATTNSVTLTWNKVTGADSYQVDVYKNGKWVYLTKTSGTSFTATGLSAGTDYQFRIFAFKGNQYSSSMKLTASTKPAAVTGLTAAPSSKGVRLSWRASTGADSYQVDMYKNGQWVYVGKTSSTTYSVTGLSSGYSYNFRVYAFKGSNYSSSTKINAFTL